ncbi:MAG TPA: hypothetical protein VJL29_09960 [Thermoguttaceae bacterium]|nr:hypothetical protein [Thermoguttaceae bacterium]
MCRPTIWAMCILLVLAGGIHAQDSTGKKVAPEPTDVTESRIPPAGGVHEIGPPVYYLEDARGMLRPAFGFTLEDFRRVYDQIHGLKPGAISPAYVLKKVIVSGTAETDYARLTIQCDILPQREGMVRIPLALDQAVLAGQPSYTGEGAPVLAFDKDHGGYVAWIRGKPTEQQRLTLKTLVPLAVLGERKTLRLRIPSGTESELSLVVPTPGVVAEASEGTMLTVAPPAQGKGSRLTVQGPRGDFELSWHKPESRPAVTPTVLESAGEVLIRIDHHGIHSTATLRVRGYGKPFDRFRVRLPAGAELAPSHGDEYNVVEAARESANDEGRVVEVQLPMKTLGPIEIRLSARRAVDASMFGQWMELAGFEVLDAARQSGYLALEASDDLDLLWDPRLGVQQHEDLPNALVHEDLVAGFKYFAQPFSLPVRVAPRQTRISVEPQYVAIVDVEQIRLEATLHYAIRGKKARVLDVDLGDWRYDEVGPDSLVAADRILQTDSGTLSIPLRQPSSGNVELTIRAHRRIASDEKTLRLTFPAPKVASPGPAAVIVVPEDRVQLTVDSAATTGMTRQQVAPLTSLAQRQQAPLFFRGDPTKAVLVAGREIHSQRIAVTSNTTIALDRRAGGARQRFSYQIDYEPLDSLRFELPDGLENVEFRVQGERVSPTAAPRNVAGAPADNDGSRRVQIALDSPKIGTCDVEARYPVRPHQLVGGSCVQHAVPLVVPLDGEPAGNRLLITAPPEMRVSMVERPWRPRTGPTAVSPDRPVTECVADGRVDRAELGLCLEPRQWSGVTIVERALIQTSLAAHSRQDRAIFRLNTLERDVQIVLPRGTDPLKTVVSLNGKPVASRADGETALRVELPQRTSDEAWLLEVHCAGAEPGPLRGRCEMELPRLGSGAWCRRVYWQLTLPPSEHVVNAPEGLAREFRWGWNGMFWGRNPLLKTADLEAWVGAPKNGPSSGGDNGYLFSAFGGPESFELVVMERSWIVLGASGAALVLGLLLIYVPAIRHPAGLFGAAVVLGGVGAIYPEPAVLALQAAALGLALTLVAGALERNAARRRYGMVVLETPASRVGRESTQTQLPVTSAAPSGNSTPTTSPEKKPNSDKTSSVVGGSAVNQ